MKIQEVQIEGLFGKKDILWKLNPQVNVLVGENGSGKSTILSIIRCVLSNDLDFYDRFLKNYCTHGMLIFEYGVKNIIFQHNIDFENITRLEASTPEELLDLARQYIKEKTTSMQIAGEVPNHPTKEENLYIDIIEANLTNSNANHIIQKSNQETTNALDMEIRETIYELNKIQSKEVIDRLILSLNVFFNQIGKNVIYQDNELIYTDIQLQKQLNYSDLSSGERQLIYILLRVALSNQDKNKTAIILMDEPEISLHVNWQADFIKQLTLLNPDAQFIIVTHSPAIIMNGWNDVYVNMEEITQ
ncbi:MULTISPECIES: AAA family ATPase [Moraxella]|uniref:ATPase AAA-type core domain-containing protein n=1 Tax=Moraxella lacunata TaxID=477 RepID=A0A1B8PWG2_MORLA|nr:MULTISPECIES: ATP-binding protein [Moraxella]MBE9577719.1 AAA family ATPase [Moraxella sp. K1664]MBE9587141.1 AAA family ATPase [Moraxella sp. K1630]MBE9589482.1 AAA family ATPase [Moraxella sp. K127]MBE9595426.1 AAA family ATPase [Moraxella sp. K2450]MDH9219970.1 ATP-binding protein [Moraxella lacunata]